MLEMLGVLTIVIMLGVSTLKLVNSIMGMFRQNLVVGEIKDLQKVISERYKFEGNYKELFEGRTPEQVAAFLCDSKMAPNQMCINGKLRHRMGGEVWVMPIENLDEEGNPVQDYSKYALVFWELTNKTCVNAAQINWYSKQKSDVYKMIINRGVADKEMVVDLPYNDEEGLNGRFPVSAVEVMKACNKDDDNDIEWVFF